MGDVVVQLNGAVAKLMTPGTIAEAMQTAAGLELIVERTLSAKIDRSEEEMKKTAPGAWAELQAQRARSDSSTSVPETPPWCARCPAPPGQCARVPLRSAAPPLGDVARAWSSTLP